MLHCPVPTIQILTAASPSVGIFRGLSDGVEILDNLADFLEILPILLGLRQGLAWSYDLPTHFQSLYTPIQRSSSRSQTQPWTNCIYARTCIKMQVLIIEVPPRGGWWGRQTTDHLRNYGQEGKEGGRDVTCYKTPVNAANYTTKYPVNNLV